MDNRSLQFQANRDAIYRSGPRYAHLHQSFSWEQVLLQLPHLTSSQSQDPPFPHFSFLTWTRQTTFPKDQTVAPGSDMLILIPTTSRAHQRSRSHEGRRTTLSANSTDATTAPTYHSLSRPQRDHKVERGQGDSLSESPAFFGQEDPFEFLYKNVAQKVSSPEARLAGEGWFLDQWFSNGVMCLPRGMLEYCRRT